MLRSCWGFWPQDTRREWGRWAGPPILQYTRINSLHWCEQARLWLQTESESLLLSPLLLWCVPWRNGRISLRRARIFLPTGSCSIANRTINPLNSAISHSCLAVQVVAMIDESTVDGYGWFASSLYSSWGREGKTFQGKSVSPLVRFHSSVGSRDEISYPV